MHDLLKFATNTALKYQSVLFCMIMNPSISPLSATTQGVSNVREQSLSQMKTSSVDADFSFRTHWEACLQPWWGVEQGPLCLQIIHCGIANSPKWPPLPFSLLAVISLHPQTLSLARIICKPYKICAGVIFSPLPRKLALIIWAIYLSVLTSNLDYKAKISVSCPVFPNVIIRQWLWENTRVSCSPNIILDFFL